MNISLHLLANNQQHSSIDVHTEDYVPAHVLEIEIGQPLPPLTARDEKTGKYYQRAMCLIRLHSMPLGVIQLELNTNPIQANDYAQLIWSTLEVQINEHLRRDGLPRVRGLDASGLSCPCTPRCIEEREQFLVHAPFVSVIIPTHNRPERIKRCLRSLLALHYPQYEIIVVDNAPRTSETADLIRADYRDVPQVCYLREDHPGPSWARNRGVMAAQGEILAFIDDDEVADPYWLVELVKGFSLSEDVTCVTGLVLPMELETPAQFWFEEYGGYGKGFSRRTFDKKENRPTIPLYPYTIGLFGTGGSMAFRAAFLRSIGGFDPTLGGVSPALCAEDTGMFFQVVKRGHKLLYEPASVVYHPHHRDYLRLRKQIYQYGIGLTACLMKTVLENPQVLFELLSKVPYGLFFTLSTRSPKNEKKSTNYPMELNIVELKGILYGPLAYILSLWAVHRTREHTRIAPSSLSYIKEGSGGKDSTASVCNTEIHAGRKDSTRERKCMKTLLQLAKSHRIMLVNAGSLVGTTAVTTSLGFVYWWLAARRFQPEVVGLSSAAISAMTLLGNFCILGLGTLLIGELPRQRGKEASLISSAIFVVGIVAGCAGIIFALVAPFVSTNFQPLRASFQDMALFTVGVSLTAVTLVLDQALIGLLHGELQLWRNTLFAGAKLAALLIAALWLSHTAGLTIYATWAIGNLVSLLALAGFTILRGKWPGRIELPQWQLLRKLGPAALQHHMLNLILQAPNLILPLLVTILLTATVNAWFYISYMLAGFGILICFSLTTVLYATTSSRATTLEHKVRLTLSLAMVTSVVANCVLFFGAKQILGIFGHVYAEQAAWSLRILGFGAFPLIIKDHYVAVCRIQGRVMNALLPTAAGVFIETGTAALGGHIAGLAGLSLGWVIGACLEALYMSRTVYKAVRSNHVSIDDAALQEYMMSSESRA
jgi:glycosyltransferase involved in cell wall biosynthesis/O-antigen/teichoic acid export membrane protein